MDVSPFLEPRIAPRAIFDFLHERADRPRFMVPDASGYRAVTFGAFAQQIEELALFLIEAGVAHGDRAAIFSANRVEWMSAALAIEAAGGVMVPVYPASTAKQAGYVIRHSDAKVVFVDGAALVARLGDASADVAEVRTFVLLDDALVPPPAIASRTVRISDALAAGRARKQARPGEFHDRMNSVALEQAALMLYTSGTSGDPKGVPLTHRNITANGRDWLQSNASLLDERAIDLLWLPMSHIFGFGEACLGNTLGFTSYLTDPMSVMMKIPEVRPNVFMSVPSVWEKLASVAMLETDVERRRAKLLEATGGRMRFCLSGGAGLKREVKELFYSAGILIIEGYGLTETSPTLTMNRPDAFRFDTVGKPMPSVELKLAEDGEILARGPNVFSGYHRDPAATAAAFTSDGWFKTGDVGRFTEDGFLQIVDRKKDILVTAGGKNVPPANIEMRFRDDALIQHVVVYGDGKRFLSAGVWIDVAAARAELGKEPAHEDIRALVATRIDRVNGELASYETIKRFIVFDEPLSVASGHLTPTLKVKRKHVYESFRAAFEAMYG